MNITWAEWKISPLKNKPGKSHPGSQRLLADLIVSVIILRTIRLLRPIQPLWSKMRICTSERHSCLYIFIHWPYCWGQEGGHGCVLSIKKQLRQMNENKRFRKAGSSFRLLSCLTFRARSGLRNQAVFREVAPVTVMVFNAGVMDAVTTWKALCQKEKDIPSDSNHSFHRQHIHQLHTTP